MKYFVVDCEDLAFSTYLAADGNYWTDYDADARNSTFGNGGDSSPSDYVSIVRFQVPKFAGVGREVTLKLKVRTYEQFAITPFFAICTSDANKNIYREKHEFIEEYKDEYQITRGTLSFGEFDETVTKTFTVRVELKPNKIYYLYLWHGNLAGLTAVSDQTISISYFSGVAHLDNGDSVKPYLCYIDKGDSWALLMTHVDNGESWDIHS